MRFITCLFLLCLSLQYLPAVVTAVSVKPTFTVMAPGATRTFYAQARDGFTLIQDAVFTWSVSGGGTINSSGVFTAGSTNGTFTVTARAANGLTTTARVVIRENTNPAGLKIIDSAKATPSPVTDTTTVLYMRAEENNPVTGIGDAGLLYYWSAVGPAPVTFTSQQGTFYRENTAKFTIAGSYTFTGSADNQPSTVNNMSTISSSVNVRVLQTPTIVSVIPATATVGPGALRTFTAAVRDQFGDTISSPVQPITWTISGGGTINSSGVFTAGNTNGTYTVTATINGKSSTASVRVSDGGGGGGDSTVTSGDSGESGKCGLGNGVGVMVLLFLFLIFRLRLLPNRR